MLISSPTRSEGDDELLEEYERLKAKEEDIQSLSPSPPPLLPDLQLVMTFIVNGKQLDVQKQATIQIEYDYAHFYFHISTLCNAKLPPHKKFYSDGIRIVFERAWVSAREFKVQRQKKQIPRIAFEDEDDFVALKHKVSCTKNPREWYLLMNAHITFENDAVPAVQLSVAIPLASPAVEQVPQRTVCFSMNYLIVDCHNVAKGSLGIFNSHSTQ